MLLSGLESYSLFQFNTLEWITQIQQLLISMIKLNLLDDQGMSKNLVFLQD